MCLLFLNALEQILVAVTKDSEAQVWRSRRRRRESLRVESVGHSIDAHLLHESLTGKSIADSPGNDLRSADVKPWGALTCVPLSAHACLAGFSVFFLPGIVSSTKEPWGDANGGSGAISVGMVQKLHSRL